MIKQIAWDEIYPIWETFLWPQRSSKIESNSAMVFNQPGIYRIENMHTLPTFVGYYLDSQLIGVSSGHRCIDNSYRIRGTWLNESHRGNGIAQQLIAVLIDTGIKENTQFAWTIPRVGASSTMFARMGFETVSDEFSTETGTNVYSKLDYTNFHISGVTPLRV
jgi:GNAT superfamily N-acetyltransferase